VARAGPDAHELEGARAEVRVRGAGHAREAQVPGETAGFDVDGGEDDDAGHAPAAGGAPEVFFAASLARSHAA